MRVLVACEYSGRVRDAFRALGYDAMSCDLLPTEAPGPHHQGDVTELLREPWDLVIAHPDCRYLANSGAKHLYQGMRRWNKDGSENPINLERAEKAVQAAKFFRACVNANAPYVAVENSVMHNLARRLTGVGQPQQTVQPWWFGEKMFKGISLRLKGLPKLSPTDKLTPPEPGTEEYKEWSWVFRMPPGPERSKKRAEFPKGVAAAMAEQFGRVAERGRATAGVIS